MLSANQPLVSVVTPVYNGEEFLDECIRSVLGQTYGNFEYIIVNNCSTDTSLEIAKRYAARDCRIRVVDNKDFLTSLQNFNHSLRQISPESKYCKIVHADDWIFPECIEKMVSLAEDNPSVGIVGSYRLVNNKVESDGLPYQKSVFPGREIARMNLTDGPYTFGSPSALLIRSDLILAREKLYNEAYTGADTEVCLELLQEVDFGFVHQVLSFYRLSDQTITGKNLYLGKGYPHCLYRFKKFGPAYFSPDESEAWIIKLRKKYYRYLGSRLICFFNKSFRNYHCNVMKDLVGERFSLIKIACGAVFFYFKKTIDLKSHLKKIINIFRYDRN